MTPAELSHEVAKAVVKAQNRVGPGSIGAEQYDGERQQFEKVDIGEFLSYLEEEALDIINYGVMLTIKLDRFRQDYQELVERMRL